MLEQLISVFKRTIRSNKYQSKKINRNGTSIFWLVNWFQGVNRVFVLWFENEAQQTSYKRVTSSGCRNKGL